MCPGEGAVQPRNDGCDESRLVVVPIAASPYKRCWEGWTVCAHCRCVALAIRRPAWQWECILRGSGRKCTTWRSLVGIRGLQEKPMAVRWAAARRARPECMRDSLAICRLCGGLRLFHRQCCECPRLTDGWWRRWEILGVQRGSCVVVGSLVLFCRRH